MGVSRQYLSLPLLLLLRLTLFSKNVATARMKLSSSLNHASASPARSTSCLFIASSSSSCASPRAASSRTCVCAFTASSSSTRRMLRRVEADVSEGSTEMAGMAAARYGEASCVSKRSYISAHPPLSLSLRVTHPSDAGHVEAHLLELFPLPLFRALFALAPASQLQLLDGPSSLRLCLPCVSSARLVAEGHALQGARVGGIFVCAIA